MGLRTDPNVVNPRVFAVVVTYEADKNLLMRLLQALGPQVAAGIVVNNGTSLPWQDSHATEAGFSVVHLGINAGVATALNRGFEWATAKGADFVITFDQDSEPAPDMVSRLLESYQRLVMAGHLVGAVGPQQVDRRTARVAPFLAPISGIRRRIFPTTGHPVKVDHLITSGCLVPVAAWHCMGKFLDPLFIDYVDVEWSLRARHFGWHLFGVEGAILTHSIGDDVKFWRDQQIPWHSPLRHYFQFRNGVYLQKLRHVPIGWKLSDCFYMLKKLVFFTLVGRPRSAHLGAMWRGFRDGLRGRLGPPPPVD
jgi:rhamnosyltransferase